MRDGGFQQDQWSRVEVEAPIVGRVITPLAKLEALWGQLAVSAEAIGVDVPNDADLALLDPYLDQVALISVAFPSFADGRGFSLARRLRARGYRGVLRASGKLVADQYAYARACGFDEVEVDPAIAARQPEAQWIAMGGSLSVTYQKGYDGAQNILEARRSAKLAAE
ncbi:MAG: DUF934 domain-containing protein [Rhodobacteraceae bacterium]|nr:DUF934 domain-containing protein [Paracoccaceae bacterium]